MACSDPVAPIGPASEIHAITATTITAVAGTMVAGGLTVHLIDRLDRSVSGAKVAFAITSGDGDVSARLVQTDASGQAHIEWTLGQTAGLNEIEVSTFGIDTVVVFSATGTPGAAVGLTVTPHILRFPTTSNAGTVVGRIVDQYGNPITGGATYISRNPGLVTVNSSGTVSVVTRGATTYVVATGANFTDSSLVVVLGPTDPPCTGITAMANLTVGQVITTGFVDNGICVPQTATGGEYALVPYFDSSVPNAFTFVTVIGFGRDSLKTPGALNSERLFASSTISALAAFEPQPLPPTSTVGHDRIRAAEVREMPLRAASARRWYAERKDARTASRSLAVPTVGEKLQFNVEPNDFCKNPVMRTGRVVAVTDKAIIVADSANPTANGFSDAEYTDFGLKFDALAYPSDITNFGAPTDLDENGRIVLFFTHAVNEFLPGTLGFFYSRDLLPKLGPFGSCGGSNVAEMLYLFVPDPIYSKTYVSQHTIATAAHEFQHLINSARRLYINTNAAPAEERWLNEGLSHVAEELVFYKASGLAPKQNIGVQAFTAPYQQHYIDYQLENTRRLREYIIAVETESPIGVNDLDEDLATRGATWSFLRYAADQRATNQAAFWQSLVNSDATGISNLYAVIGADTRLMMRDWALSIFLDDLVPTAPAYQQPSWNLRQLSTYVPFTRKLTSGVPLDVTVRAGGNTFARFGLAAGQEAFVRVTGSNGAALPKNVLLALVRTK